MIEFEIPGETGKANCVAVCVSMGTESHRLLLDCGGERVRTSQIGSAGVAGCGGCLSAKLTDCYRLSVMVVAGTGQTSAWFSQRH